MLPDGRLGSSALVTPLHGRSVNRMLSLVSVLLMACHETNHAREPATQVSADDWMTLAPTPDSDCTDRTWVCYGFTKLQMDRQSVWRSGEQAALTLRTIGSEGSETRVEVSCRTARYRLVWMGTLGDSTPWAPWVGITAGWEQAMYRHACRSGSG
jgi:hypothetical protein